MGTLDNQRAKELAIRWGLNVRHALYRATGNWYHRLKKFPGALLDADGYVIFESSQAFEECPQLQVRKQVSAPKGIKAIPSYVYVSGDRDRQSSMVMADDIKIIEQIEKQIGKKLKRLPLKNIMKLENNGYVLNDAGQVQGLNLDGTKVKDISFLRNLGGLTHLSLANNQITDLTPLRTLTNLKDIELRNNKIEDITPLAALTHLERLILIKNRISDISPLSGLIEINTLSLSNNKIIELSPLIPLTSLIKLWLNKNNINDLTPLSALTQLVTLGLRLNRINDITPLKELRNLKGLNVSRNNITKLPPDIDRWWSSMEIIWVDDDTADKDLNLFDNPLTDPPVEIVKQGKAAVKDYFDSLGYMQSSIHENRYGKLEKEVPMPSKILVVDDEPDWKTIILQEFRKQIQQKEWEFVFAHNGFEALEKLNKIPGIAIIILDIVMPEMDGLTFLSKLNETNNTSIKTIVVTAFGDMDIIRKTMNAGVFDFLTKPINLDDLEITINKALKQIELEKKVESSTKPKVLWIDDDKLILETGIPFLENSDLELSIDGVTSGRQGIEKLRQRKNYYSLIFLDLNMPELDGIKTLKEIRKIDSNIPVILISAHFGESRWERQLESLKNSYYGRIEKPFPMISSPYFKELAYFINSAIKFSKSTYNYKARILIEKERYYEALLIIKEAENKNCADDNTRALKEKVIKSLSDDEEQSYKRSTKEGRSFNYPESGSTLGRDGEITKTIEILDKIPIVTVFGIPGIGKSRFIHELRKHKSYNNRLYKRIIAKPGMTVNDLFLQLALLLGCRDMLERPDFDLSQQPSFPFLEKEAQYRLESFIHLDDAQFLFREDGFQQPVIGDFLSAITRFYPGTRIVLESQIIPPDGLFPGDIYKSIRVRGIDKDSMLLYFRNPFKDDPLGLEFTKGEQESILHNLGGVKEQEKIHPLSMVLLANLAKRLDITPIEILTNTETLQKFSDESESLLLEELNQLAAHAGNWNIPLNLEMYLDDVPGYLSERLQKSVGTLFPGTRIEALQVSDPMMDNLEKELRKVVSEKLYLKGKELLQEIISRDPDSIREERLKEEFGFIYDFEEEQIEWRRKIWQILSMRNDFELQNIDQGEAAEEDKTNIQEAKTGLKEEIKDRKITGEKDKSKKSSEKIGEELEKAVLKLFKDFFAIWEEDHSLILENARQQGRGLQFGHDLKFVCGRWDDKEIRLLIECKNYSDKITTKDIADKLMEVEDYYDIIPIDHWILISPNADLANELERFIESWEKKGKYPFKVQTWTPATRVKEFFGLDPGIYDKFIKVQDLKSHPKDWNAKKRQEVIEYWRDKLEPPLRLPRGWQDYLHEPLKLLLEPKEREFEKRYNTNDYVELKCKDDSRSAIAQPLEEKIALWLEEPVSESPTIFLLGEFGDGKTFFTYVLSRKLAEKFRASPKEEWLPVRFALKNFESEGLRGTQTFIQHRLKDFGADIAGWNELRSSGYKLLAILDGFDEISKALDPDTIQKNIDTLIECYTSDYFSGMKLLITSRKHFFENQKDKDKLLDKLDKPQLLHLSPIDRKTTEDYLRNYAASIGEEEKFKKIKDCPDPIGLASKPLFLEMVQVSLKELPKEKLNEYSLYETYINKALKRKEEDRFDKKKETPKDKSIENLKNVLELVAQRLLQFKREYVFLSEIRGKEDLKEWLWELSDPDKTCIEDETGQIASRSLLKRVDIAGYPDDKQWPVDFCHRSMREYFVARAVCNMVEKDPEDAGEFLTGSFLSHEIISFAGKIMINKNRENGYDYEKNLLMLIEKTRNVENIKRMDLNHLGGNAVNLLYKYKDLLPGSDWSNLVLDGAILPEADLSGKDFSNTSLQYANLDNVNFTGSNFTRCNLTDVRIEETAPVQSIAISPTENILALYQDGILREWEYQQRQRPNSTNLDTGTGISGNELKIIAQPGHDLTILNDRFLFFYNREGKNLKRKASIEMNPGFRLIKASRDFLLLNEAKGKQYRLSLVDLHRLAVVKSIDSSFTLCDHLDDQALVIFNENAKEKLQVLDISSRKRAALFIPVKEKISCLAACPCSQKPGNYLLGLGLENGAVQIWQIQVDEWKREKLLDHVLHEQAKPIKDISFIDEYRIVTGSLDKTIRLLTFDHEGRIEGEVKEFKMTLQCRGMKIDGITRDKIEGKKLRELLDKAAEVE